MPLLGNAIAVYKSFVRAKEDNQHVLNHAVVSACPSDSQASVGLFITNGAFLVVSDPEVVLDLYTKQNKYFDKHPLVKEVAHCLTGESTLFVETTKDWKNTRQAMTPAFTSGKGKLANLVKIAKKAV